MSTHTCEIDIDGIPEQAQISHIVLGLAHASLISIILLCGASFKVQYDESRCSVYFNNNIGWKGGREPRTRLWVLTLQNPKTTHPKTDTRDTEHHANNVYDVILKVALIKYLHQAAFIAPKWTLIKAIDNKQFSSAVQKYLTDSAPVTDKGYMKQQKQGIRRTK